MKSFLLNSALALSLIFSTALFAGSSCGSIKDNNKDKSDASAENSMILEKIHKATVNTLAKDNRCGVNCGSNKRDDY